MEVIKRDNRREPFVREKIIAALVKAGTDAKSAREICQRLEEKLREKKVVTTQEIREIALEELKRRSQKAFEYWVFYEKAVKKRI